MGDVYDVYNETGNKAVSEPKQGLTACSVSRMNTKEGVVITADGVDYTLDNVAAPAIHWDGPIPVFTFEVHAPKMEIYIP